MRAARGLPTILRLGVAAIRYVLPLRTLPDSLHPGRGHACELHANVQVSLAPHKFLPRYTPCASLRLSHRADVAELADALGSGLSSRKGVEVQVLSSAPKPSVL